MKIWAEELLAGYNFIGAADLALYINLPANAASRAPSVAWHVHLLVWDFDEGKLQEVLDRINDEERSFVPGRSTAHRRTLQPGAIRGRAAYMMKAPLSEYIVYARKEAEDESGFDDSGLAQQGRTEQRKRLLRPGNAIKLCHALSGRTLPSLMVSGGAGSGILGTALTNATAEIREKDASRQRKLERLFN